MLCANLRETPPMSVKSASSFHREPAYPRCRRAAAGPHEFAAADELGPTWRAARARGVALPRSSGDPPRAADRVSPGGLGVTLCQLGRPPGTARLGRVYLAHRQKGLVARISAPTSYRCGRSLQSALMGSKSAAPVS